MSKPDWHGLLGRWLNLEDQTARELQFQNWLHGQLEPYFHLKREVEGLSVFDTGQRIDFLARARRPLLRGGFTPEVFGIEAKYPLGWTAHTMQHCCRWVGQMSTYATSRFDGKAGPRTIRPAFILSAPPVSDLLEERVNSWTAHIMHQIRLGELHLRPRRDYDVPLDALDRDYETVFEIRFSGGIYWRNLTLDTRLHPGNWLIGEQPCSNPTAAG